MKLYQVVKEDKILKMGFDKVEILDYYLSFPPAERQKLWIADKEIPGSTGKCDTLNSTKSS